MENKFLLSFMNMRKQLNASQAAVQTMTPARRVTDVPAGSTLASILEDKPPKSEVIEYLRKRIEECVELEEMNDGKKRRS
jgi:hypothetical protein